MTEFKDKYGIIGRPKRAPISAVEIAAKSASRSLDKQSVLPKTATCEIRKDKKLYMDTSNIIGDRIVIKKKDAIALARWILSTYGVDK